MPAKANLTPSAVRCEELRTYAVMGFMQMWMLIHRFVRESAWACLRDKCVGVPKIRERIRESLPRGLSRTEILRFAGKLGSTRLEKTGTLG